MEMQDKEFDQLFNAKLGEFEIEPSEKVWHSIARELDGKKAKRSIMPYLSIAASVIVVASISLLFLNRKVEKPEQPDNLVKIKPVKPLSTETNDQPVVVDRVAEDDDYLKEATAATVEAKRTAQVNKTPQTEQTEQQMVITPREPVVEKPEPLLAVARTETRTSSQPAEPTVDIPLNTKLTAAVEVESTNEGQPDVLAGSASPKHVEAKKRARGLGGLINTVIAAVDKREDKLIEFTDLENDEGTKVTAVNLGLFKIKRQQN